MGASRQQQTVTQEVDPFIKERTTDLLDRVEGFQYQPYPGGSRVAPFSPTQVAAQDFLTSRLAGPGTGIAEAEQAAGVARGVAEGGMVPSVVAGDIRSGIDRFRDPYEDQVVNTALGDIDRSRQMALQDVRSVATQAGAFGGDRAAILEAETNRGFADQAARTAAQLRSQGFGRAADLARAQAGLGLNADLANQDATFRGRGQQLQGAGLLSSLGGDIFRRTLGTGQALGAVGAQQQGQAQSELSDEVSRFREEADFPLRQIGLIQSILSGFPGGFTQTSSIPHNRGAGLAGGALSGAGIGAAFGPLGAGIGGGIGGLLGLL